MGNDNQHDAVSGRLSAYLDGEVSAGERRVIEAHLVECGICEEILKQLRAVSTLVRDSAMGRLGRSEAEAAFVRQLHERVDAIARRGVERFAWGLSAAAACIAIVAGLQLMRPLPASTVAAAAPAAWEGTAVRLNGTNTAVAEDTTPAANNGDLAMTEWMVADLSEGNAAR
jgi:anti-sigma factor RsiW